MHPPGTVGGGLVDAGRRRTCFNGLSYNGMLDPVRTSVDLRWRNK